MKKLIQKLLFVTAIISMAVLPFQAQAADGVKNSKSLTKYVVQLNTESTLTLNSNSSISKIEPLFEFSNSEKFQNTYTFNSTSSLEQLKSELGNNIQSLEVDSNIEVDAVKVTVLPNDPAFTTNATNIDKQWGLVKAGFVEAWKKTTGNKSVVVAVIDTGLDGTHEDLKGSKLVSGYNILKKNKISPYRNSDDNGHGTLISGVIAATSNNRIGIAGAATKVAIMPIKALDADGSGSSSKVSEAIVWAADHDADIINLSLGGVGFGHNKLLANAITYAFEKNVVIISAAGNDVAVTGGNLDKEPVFPICDDNGKNMIIGVTATDVNDLKPAFANYGKACVDVSAPGRRIMSTINYDPASGASSPDSYAYASGTSLAVPFVSAQAALLRSLFPDATNRQIRDRIISTADNIDKKNISQCAGQSCTGYLGGGRINVAKSLEEQIIKIADGDLVKVEETGNFYLINGGKKQLVSSFVKNQRFANKPFTLLRQSDLDGFPEGSYAEPRDGTLVKSPNEPSVYYMESGLRRPLTGQVFAMRGFRFSDIVTLTNVEVGSWIEGSFLAPPDNSIIRAKNNPTLYWIINGSLRPVNYNFYISRELNKLPIIYVPDGDISKFPKGDAYIL